MTENYRNAPRKRSASVRAEEYNTLRISQVLYSLRMKLGNRTQAECAELIGFPSSIWGRHEKGNIKLINLNFINKVCDTFGYKIEDVLVKKQPKNKAERIKLWATSDKAYPYIEKAYEEYLADKLKIKDVEKQK